MKQIASNQFQSEVIDSDVPVVVDFYTDSCPPCRAMAPLLQEWEAETNGALKLVKIDAAAEGALAATHRVSAVPTFLLFAGGKCIAQTVGLKSKNSMKKWFEDAMTPGA